MREVIPGVRTLRELVLVLMETVDRTQFGCIQ